ncbi:MAG TPA: hypothetical protein VFZ25_20860, partial [Chloroflexota bacterium]|nr:hypothetical protein [Chloroflexota bacterium]
SVTVQGFEDINGQRGAQVNITATGSEGNPGSEGHFTSDAAASSTIIRGTEGGSHTTELTVPGLTGIVCEEAGYEGTVAGATAESVSVTPAYGKCKTTKGTAGEVNVDLNGCQYQFTIEKKSSGDNPADLVCSGATKFITVTHPNCEIRIPAQTVSGLAYTTTVESSKHAITVDATVKGLETNFEAGACVLLGTKKESELSGSVTVKGRELAGEGEGAPVDITAEPGRLTSDSPSGSTIITGGEGDSHTTELTVPGLTGIVCEEASYEGTAEGEIAQAITVTPSYNDCKTTRGRAGEVKVDLNECQYQFIVGLEPAGDNAVALVCPGASKFIAVTHPNCEIRIPAQNNITGVAYTTTVESEKQAITVDATVKGLETNFESGACVLLGTKEESELSGSATVQGFEDDQFRQVNITATGSEG